MSFNTVMHGQKKEEEEEGKQQTKEKRLLDK
jgi:hypothetical protein